MKKSIFALLAIALVIGLVGAAFAVKSVSADVNPPTQFPGNSEPGIGRYLDNPGRIQAGQVGAQCDTGAGSGSFGYFGQDLNMAGGANGYQTGINNSSVCGNRIGNLP